MKGTLVLMLVLPGLISAGCLRSAKSTDTGARQAKKQEEQVVPTESRREAQASAD